MVRLCCIIVHYGNNEHTLACLKSLCLGSIVPFCIVVNNTPDSNIEANCRAIFDDAGHGDSMIFHHAGSNQGFAASCNLGLEIALKTDKISHIWLLNNDTRVAADATERLRDCCERHKSTIIGTAVYHMDQPDRLELALGCRFSPWTTRIRPLHANALPKNVIPTLRADYVYGASMVFPLQLVREIGMLDDRFFLYYEEHDFCVRAQKNGYTYHWCPEAKVWHLGGGGTQDSSGKTSEARSFTQYHENVSTWRFVWKHYPWALPVAVLVRTLAKLVLLPLRGDCFLLKSYFRSFGHLFTAKLPKPRLCHSQPPQA